MNNAHSRSSRHRLTANIAGIMCPPDDKSSSPSEVPARSLDGVIFSDFFRDHPTTLQYLSTHSILGEHTGRVTISSDTSGAVSGIFDGVHRSFHSKFSLQQCLRTLFPAITSTRPTTDETQQTPAQDSDNKPTLPPTNNGAVPNSNSNSAVSSSLRKKSSACLNHLNWTIVDSAGRRVNWAGASDASRSTPKLQLEDTYYYRHIPVTVRVNQGTDADNTQRFAFQLAVGNDNNSLDTDEMARQQHTNTPTIADQPASASLGDFIKMLDMDGLLSKMPAILLRELYVRIGEMNITENNAADSTADNNAEDTSKTQLFDQSERTRLPSETGRR